MTTAIATAATVTRAPRVALAAAALDASRPQSIRAHLDRLFDDAFDEGLRFRRGRAARLYRAQQRRLKRRLVLFEIERHLLVSDLAAQRPHEEPVNGRASVTARATRASDDRERRVNRSHSSGIRRDEEAGHRHRERRGRRRAARASYASGGVLPR